MKIVNLSKFVRSIILLLGICILFCLFINNTSFSYGDIQYKYIYVSNGDTLWKIAKEEKDNNKYYSNKDIRDIVDNIKYLNKLENSNLKMHQELKIPII
ncbi:MAG: LysM peptidoglycan-binding domain-containing protein [Clostridia bacterium]|jgi:hypothetical protein|nr:LysM peptidoglycan-binding domain-containing protein [Clostridia bacterium]